MLVRYNDPSLRAVVAGRLVQFINCRVIEGGAVVDKHIWASFIDFIALENWLFIDKGGPHNKKSRRKFRGVTVIRVHNRETALIDR